MQSDAVNRVTVYTPHVGDTEQSSGGFGRSGSRSDGRSDGLCRSGGIGGVKNL